MTQRSGGRGDNARKELEDAVVERGELQRDVGVSPRP